MNSFWFVLACVAASTSACVVVASSPDVADVSSPSDVTNTPDVVTDLPDASAAADGPDVILVLDVPSTDTDTGSPLDVIVTTDTRPPPDTSSSCPIAGFSGTLALFDMTGQPGTEVSVSGSSSATGVIIGDLSRSAGLTAVAGMGSINSHGWPLTTTAAPGKYYTFMVTVPVGCALSVDMLSLDVMSSGTGPTMGVVATSVDGFGAQTAFGENGIFAITPAGATGVSAPLEVRIYGFDASAAAGTLRIQNMLTLTGSID